MNATHRIRFQPSDFKEDLPEEGYHTCVIQAVRPRTSERGNATLQVVYELDDGEPGSERVYEYFIVGGATPLALHIGRRRLLSLCRACGLDPKEGDELEPADLVERELEILIGHVTHEGKRRVRVLDYRPLR